MFENIYSLRKRLVTLVRANRRETLGNLNNRLEKPIRYSRLFYVPSAVRRIFASHNDRFLYGTLPNRA